MIELKAKNEESAKQEILELSKSEPSYYFYTISCFGLFAEKSKRLHVNAPGDAIFKWYVKGGTIKPFTNSQIIQDQINTPQMS